MKKEKDKYSPGMRQFLDIKKDYEDYILFFQMGDFFEFFFDDAVLVSQELEMVLTSRSSTKDDDKIPMCGMPLKAADAYIDVLVDKGYKIALCVQVEDPKDAKGVVKREVVQLITPGTVMQGKTLEAKSNNYIACLNVINESKFGLIYSDLSTGEVFITLVKGDFKEVISELSRLSVKEIVVNKSIDTSYIDELENILGCLISYECETLIHDDFLSIVSDISDNCLLDTCGMLLNYLIKTQKRSLGHLQNVEYYEINNFMTIDIYSKRNLELFETSRNKDKKGSLLNVLDSTVTSMGGRRLKQWIERPLLSKFDIENRLCIVESLLNSYYERNELRELLKNVYDLERLSGRVAFGNVNAKDLIQLKKSLKYIPEIVSLVNSLGNEFLSNKFKNIDLCEPLYELLELSIIDDPTNSIKEGNIIKDNYNEKLDSYRNVLGYDKKWVSDFEKKEKEETGIKLLKVNYNRAAGYYIEIPKNHVHLLPEGRYERKQTLTNVERFITKELKEKEQLILEAEDKIVGLEYDIFLEIRNLVSKYIPKLQNLAKSISELDVLQSFAEVSDKNCYTKPLLSSENSLVIKGGRHPVIESVLSRALYIKNDCYMDNNKDLFLITGPNMSGKSTYMRQIALTSIMAQIGCFVACDYAELPVFDQIFTRIGAADDLVSGQSTFMVEMMETQNALSKSTKDSLILLDEIGRGTSTYDGVAIAQSIIEYVHNFIGAKTFFSTHYHELTMLEKDLSRLKNVRVCVIEENDTINFIHKVEEGAADKSYGIYVASLAGLPDVLINRAKSILKDLEDNISIIQNQSVELNDLTIEEEPLLDEGFLLDEKPLLDEEPLLDEVLNKTETISDSELDVLLTLKSLNPLEISPMDAFNLINNLINKVK